MKHVFTFTLLLAAAMSSGFAQTGPGGVGNTGSVDLWLNASDDVFNSGTTPATNGQTVETWGDVSGNGNDLGQPVEDQKPTLVTNALNGHPVLNFDGTNDNLFGDLSSSISAMNIFIVSSFDLATQGASDYDFVYSLGKVNEGITFTRWRGSGGQANMYTAVMETANRRGPAITTTAYQLYNQQFTTSAPFHFYFLNNASQTVTAHTNTVVCDSRIVLGGHFYKTVSNFDGKVAEMIVYDQTLNTTQRNIISNYLAAKYNLTISSDKYAFQAAHGNEVAGIGRESVSDNHTSARGTSIVQITNASDLEDGEYMLWGHDNAGTGNAGTEIPTSYTASGLKLNQEWRVDISGGDNSVGTVSITFDMTGIGFGIASTYYQLISDPDGDFSDGDETVHAATPSINGNLITFNNVTLADGDFFTIANSNDVEDCASFSSSAWNSVFWFCGVTPPDSTVNVQITDGTVVNTGVGLTQSAHDLVIDEDFGGGGGHFTVSANATMIVTGDLTIGSGGTLAMGAGSTLILRGTANQTVTNNSGSTIALTSMYYSNDNELFLEGDGYTLSGDLTVRGGNLNINSPLTFGASATLTVAGTAAQSILNTSGNTLTLFDITIDNAAGVSIDSDWELTNGLTLDNGNLNSTGTFTFISDATQTAHVSSASNGANLVGTYTVQRFVPARAANWNNITTSGVDTDIEDLDGEIFISGIENGDGNALSGGQVFVSMWMYDNIGDDYVAVQNTNEAFGIGIGYETWLADDISDWFAKAWTLQGEIDMAPVSLPVNSAGERWNFLGNPYPSFLDWDAIANDNGGVDGDEFWYFDADLASYVSVSGASSMVQPGQGFWIQTTGINSLDIDPSTHLLDENTSDLLRAARNQELTIRFTDMERVFGSAAYLRKHPAAYEGLDEFDVTPLRHPDARASLVTFNTDSRPSMVNYINTDADKLELPLTFTPGQTGTFNLEIEGVSYMNEYQCVQLYDAQQDTYTELDENAAWTVDVTAAQQPMTYVLILSKDYVSDCSLADPNDEQYTTGIAQIRSEQKSIIADFNLAQSSNAIIEVYSSVGALVYSNQATVGHNRMRIDLNHVQSGMYFVSVTMNGKTTTDKVILQ